MYRHSASESADNQEHYKSALLVAKKLLTFLKMVEKNIMRDR